MNLIELIQASGLLILGMMTLLWLVSLALKNSSIVDIFWGIGFILVVWVTFNFAQGYLPRKQLVAILVTIWGLRLSIHIGIRNWGKPEDFRYAKWRADNGRHWWWVSFFKVFLLQGFLIWIVSILLLTTQASGFPAILTPLDLVGASLWTLGLLIETIADSQLRRFKSDPAIQTISVRLWSGGGFTSLP